VPRGTLEYVGQAVWGGAKGALVGTGIAEVANAFLPLTPSAKRGIQGIGIFAGALKGLTGIA
jgi:hypothetical protein